MWISPVKHVPDDMEAPRRPCERHVPRPGLVLSGVGSFLDIARDPARDAVVNDYIGGLSTFRGVDCEYARPFCESERVRQVIAHPSRLHRLPVAVIEASEFGDRGRSGTVSKPPLVSDVFGERVEGNVLAVIIILNLLEELLNLVAVGI